MAAGKGLSEGACSAGSMLAQTLRRWWRAGSRIVLFPLGFAALCLWGFATRRRYRIAVLPMANLGGVAWQLDAFIRRQSAEPDYRHYVFIAKTGAIANTYFLELLKRKLTFIENRWLAWLLRPVGEISNPLNFRQQLRYPASDEIGRYPCADWFNSDDHARGRELFRQIGLDKPGAWYVCFFARDNAYAEQTNSGSVLEHYLNYHTCRNSRIEAQVDAMEFVLAQGGHVIRIGSLAKTPVPIRHPRLIDYPFSSFRSDFADIYLVCHAKFVIGDASGIIDVSLMRDVPFGWINEVFYFCSSYRKNAICIPKLICNEATGKVLTLAEFNDLLPKSPKSLLGEMVDRMRERDLVYLDNSSDDILAVAKAMYYKFVSESVLPEIDHAFCVTAPESIWPPFFELHPELLG